MASRRQRKKISEKNKKRKTRAATTRKKFVKVGCRDRRQDTAVSESATPVSIKVQDEENHNERARLRRDKRTCGVCGACRIHDNDYFCPYNYIHGCFGLSTCREGCRPRRHSLLLTTSSSCSGSHQPLRRLVRVTNVPLSMIPGEHELSMLFKRFGPLIKCNLTRVSLNDDIGFGWIMFESRKNAEKAINKLNGYLVTDRKLRVDWAYPRA